jgi:hypothetical protein
MRHPVENIPEAEELVKALVNQWRKAARSNGAAGVIAGLRRIENMPARLPRTFAVRFTLALGPRRVLSPSERKRNGRHRRGLTLEPGEK